MKFRYSILKPIGMAVMIILTGCVPKETNSVDIPYLEAESQTAGIEAKIELYGDNKEGINRLNGNENMGDLNEGGNKSGGSEVEGINGNNGKCVLGDAVSYTVTKKKITVKEVFPPSVSKNEIPKEKMITYYDERTGKDEVTKGVLIETGIDKSNIWTEEKEAEWIYESKNENDCIWNLDDGKTVNLSLKNDKPVWEGYEIDIANNLGLSDVYYKVKEAKWDDEIYYEDGLFKRKAQYVLTSEKRGYYAIYEGEGIGVEETNLSRKETDNLLLRYREINEDVYGLIKIEGTKLNHPIMRCEEDEGFYLWHDLEKKYNSHGVPFITLDSDLDRQMGNSLIYGHRLNDGDVFGELSNYESIDFYKEHPIIETVTDKGKSRWMIFAYFLICNNDEETFDYYNDYTLLSEKRFNEYMEEVKKRNWLDVPFDYSNKDSFLTLSSCSKEKTGEGNNRMVVMAVKIKDDFGYQKTVEKSTLNPNPLLPEKLR